MLRPFNGPLTGAQRCQEGTLHWLKSLGHNTATFAQKENGKNKYLSSYLLVIT